jgi:hypothetical protein
VGRPIRPHHNFPGKTYGKTFAVFPRHCKCCQRRQKKYILVSHERKIRRNKMAARAPEKILVVCNLQSPLLWMERAQK